MEEADPSRSVLPACTRTPRLWVCLRDVEDYRLLRYSDEVATLEASNLDGNVHAELRVGVNTRSAFHF